MAARKPLVMGNGGNFEQLQPGDSLDLPVLGPGNAVSRILPVNYTTTSNVVAKIPELSVPLESGSLYWVYGCITFKTDALTTGVGIGVYVPTGGRNMLNITIPLYNVSSAQALHAIMPAGNMVEGFTSTTASVGVADSWHTAMIQGMVRCGSTAGDFEVYLKSEINGSLATFQAGSEICFVKIM